MPVRQSIKTKIGQIQKAIRTEGIDGWLLYDFRGSNPFASGVMEIPSHMHRTRRMFYYIPARGNPHKVVHNIEERNLDHLPGRKHIYVSWRSLEKRLGAILQKARTVAMEYTPYNAIPYVSIVDAGMIELVRRQKVKIVSSANLVQRFEAVWSEKQFRENKKVARVCLDTMQKAFVFIGRHVKARRKVTEYDVQQFILREFRKHSFYTDHPPNCSVNANAANPHYEPTEKINSRILKGDFVLIDLWAKANNSDGVYSDITWTGYVGHTVPDKYTKIFNIVREARNRTFAYVGDAMKAQKRIRGCDLDDVARSVIEKSGYGKYFIHRTGHSIGKELHDNGAHLDNLETRDLREIIPGTSFTIEPGIYLPGDFGIRSEIDVYIDKRKRVMMTAGPAQTEVLPILSL
jgi:Xaa-Pro dipeptidase